MKIEAGKYYLTRDGRKVGPMVRWTESGLHPFECPDATDAQLRNSLWGESGEGFEKDPDLIAEWTDAPTQDTPKLWKDMTPEEKGALLLAEHEGKVIEVKDGVGWYQITMPAYNDRKAYRIKPSPVVETVVLYDDCMTHWSDNAPCDAGYRITFQTIDGQPDCASIRMEPLS